jgi:hypothetical protein
MNIEILLVTCNRLGYTRQAMAALLADPTDFLVSIWDNASTDGTREFVESVKDPRIRRRVFARENAFLAGAANQVFADSKAELLAIIPDDFLVPPGWTRPLAAFHADVPQAGLVSCWFLGEAFFDEKKAQHKIQTFGQHRILRHPWTGGGAALFKRRDWEAAGRFKGLGTPSCWIQMAVNGRVNGFILPPVFVEHMDDFWSPYYSGSPSGLRKMAEQGKAPGWFAKDEQVWEFQLAVVDELLRGPWDVRCYLGWRGRLRDVKNRLRRLLQNLGVGARRMPPPQIQGGLRAIS